jgi:hypothetical protein
MKQPLATRMGNLYSLLFLLMIPLFSALIVCEIGFRRWICTTAIVASALIYISILFNHNIKHYILGKFHALSVGVVNLLSAGCLLLVLGAVEIGPVNGVMYYIGMISIVAGVILIAYGKLRVIAGR